MLKEFLSFRRMLIPYLVQIIFWLSIAACIASAIFNFYNHMLMPGLTILILGPIAVRLACEFVVVLFEINDTLFDIKQMLAAVSPSTVPYIKTSRTTIIRKDNGAGPVPPGPTPPS